MKTRPGARGLGVARTRCLSWLSRKISPDQAFFLFLLSLLLLWYINLYVKFLTLFPRFIPCESKILANVPDRFDGFNNSAAALLSDGEPLVPNVIHFVRVGEGSEIVAVEEAACISAALRALPGSTAIIHTDRPELRGVGWERLLGREGGRIRVQRRPRSLHVFGLPYRDLGTMHRVAALRVLIKHGGVYVPNKTYLTDATATVYRQLECATASAASSDLGVVLAHRDARQLQQWLRLHHDADLVWAERPPHEPHLCRAIEELLSLEAKENLAELVHGGDEYLLAPVLPAVAAVDDEA